MEPSLRETLSGQQVTFKFNPASAPHVGGSWEREVRSVKEVLRIILGNQSVMEPVLRTVLIEVEGILNSKPRGYLFTDASDPDPITPNLLLMGRRDASLPQAMFADTDIHQQRRWRHSQWLAVRDYLPAAEKEVE